MRLSAYGKNGALRLLGKCSVLSSTPRRQQRLNVLLLNQAEAENRDLREIHSKVEFTFHQGQY
jgi:hypothetical protein